MKFKDNQTCDKCGKLTKSLRIYKGRWLCYCCWIKKVIIIGGVGRRRKKEK